MLLGYGLWQSAFGGDPGVLGRRVSVGRERVTVVGVLDQDLETPFASPALVRPLALRDDARRGSRWLTVIARLAPGRTEREARAELEALAQAQAREFPDSNTGWTVTLVSLPEARARGWAADPAAALRRRGPGPPARVRKRRPPPARAHPRP